ncbi:Protein phosphatase 2C 2, partial [Tulasnella sp. 427]
LVEDHRYAPADCVYQCDFTTCAVSDVACQCNKDYLQSIYNCASCNTNNKHGGTQISDYQTLLRSCEAQGLANPNDAAKSTDPLPSPTSMSYVAPSLTGNGVVAPVKTTTTTNAAVVSNSAVASTTHVLPTTMTHSSSVASAVSRATTASATYSLVSTTATGASAAKFSGENVPKRLASEEAYKSEDYKLALKRAFLGTDEDLRSDSNFFRDPSGCTAVVALITADDKIYVANAGDSRSVLGVKGEAKPLSFDHKPGNEGESSRIRAAGGFVEYGRVNGNLALSRAIGDFEFKSNQSLEPEKQIVTSDPEITVHEPTEDDEFLVLACDGMQCGLPYAANPMLTHHPGIWDCLTSQQVVDIVRRLIAEKKELDEICEVIMDKCLAPDSDINGGVGCDNMTVVVVALLRGRTKEEWYNWVADRVENKVGYETPKELPQLYSASRVAAAKERWGAPRGQFTRPAGLSNLARVFGTNIMFHPSGGISSNGTLDPDDSSEEYESEEGEHDPSSKDSSLQAPPSKDPNAALREQLDKLKEDGEGDEDTPTKVGSERKWTIDDDGDSQMDDQSGADSKPTITKSTIFNRRVGGKNAQQAPETTTKEEPEIGSPLEPTKLPVGLSAAPPVSIGKPLIRSPAAISTPELKSKELQVVAFGEIGAR